jgi:tetratricopeptide (TPR) repeat protein
MKTSPRAVVLLALASAVAIGTVAVLRSGGGETSPRIDAAEQRSTTVDPLKVVLTPIGGTTKVDAQIAELQGRIKDAPQPNMLLERLGWAFVAKSRESSDPGYYTLAEQTAKAMLATNPAEAAAMLLLGHTYHAMHRFADAEAAARKLTSQREFVFDYALLGDALMEQGKLPAAVEAYQKMVDLKPNLQTYSRVAHVRWLKGDLAGAVRASRLAVNGGSPREPEPIAWAYTRLAQYELQAGNVETAAESVELAARFLPDHAPVLLMRGRLLLSQNKHEEALEPLRRAAELNPLPEYLWTLADALRATSKIGDAEKVEAQLARTGSTSDARTFAIFLASRRENVAKALELATAELESRQDIFTHDAVAWAHFASGRIDEARQHMQQALAEGTEDARLFYHAGAIAAAAHDEAAALEFFAKARRIAQMLLPSERAALETQTAALLKSGAQLSVN